MIANLALAAIARIAGTLTGRPVSGQWLARYFAGKSSSTHSLPPQMESQILALAKDQMTMDFCKCMDNNIATVNYNQTVQIPDPDCPICNGTGDVLPSEPFTVCPPYQTDLYTCVGTFSVQWQEGSLRYQDAYDWHTDMNWSFNIRLGFLPFSIEIKGQDTWFAKVGKEFLTAGTIAPCTLPATSFDSVRDNTFSLSKLVRSAKMWLWGSRSQEKQIADSKYIAGVGGF